MGDRIRNRDAGEEKCKAQGGYQGRSCTKRDEGKPGTILLLHKASNLVPARSPRRGSSRDGNGSMAAFANELPSGPVIELLVNS